ncbi:MAG TPA: thiopeptide-type bacteriocin biosynthesis protein, partial [Pseudonocardiaceae bacterium]|nr:thiopeptide-type bacteriocin biosynthesis protein [Pseudonocardiaceae bacterium]
PRVRYRRFVLSPAVWRLDELHDISTGPDGEWTAALAGWRARYDVPRHVQVVSNDQRLRLDLDRPWHAALLREELRKDPGLVVHELPGEQQGWLGSDIAGHLTEIVVPLQRRDPTSPRAATPAYAESRRTVHGLGGEWLYLKLYGSAAGQDELLRTHVPALVDAAREHGADRWFFLRYTDPDGHHLRLRLHGDPAELWACAAGELGRILRSWQDCGLLREHRLDQYDPEFERYGGAGLAGEVERLFAADSAAAIELLNLAADPACPYDLDTLVAASVAALAHAFGPPSSAAGSGSCAGEAALEPAEAWLSRTGSRRDLPKRFRKDPGYFARLLDPAGGWPGLHGEVFGEKVLATLHSRDEQVVATRARMDSLRARHACHTEEGRFVGSLMHMTCNRLLGGDSARERDAVAVARGAVQDGAKRRRHGQ